MKSDQELIKEILIDIGLEDLLSDGLRRVPLWIYDMAEKLVDSGWRKP